MKSILEVENLSIGYSKKNTTKVICSPMNLSLESGEFVCMLGANGSGKTTLLKTLGGVIKPIAGTIKIHSKSISGYSPQELSKLLSVVLTERVGVGNLKVSELVALGRYPYTNWLGGMTSEDRNVIDWALEVTNTLKFADRHLGELSDGEHQKVMIARALAQNTEIILLDEPTAHLDLPNRVEIFQLLQRLAAETQKTILLSTHELDLSIQSACKIWLIKAALNEQIATEGTLPNTSNEIVAGVPEDLILDGTFENAFKSEKIFFDKATGKFKVNVLLKQPVNLIGDGTVLYWTERALERTGHYIDNNQSANIKIEIKSENSWCVTIKERTYNASSVEKLLEIIALKDIEQLS